MIKQERQNNSGIVLVLDAGSTLTGQWVSTASKGGNIVDAMNAMGYDALTIGQMDMAAGIDALKEREKEAKFPFLSANLVSVADGQPIFTPYVILERQQRRIAILGLTEPDAMQTGQDASKAKLLDPIETAQRYVPELRGQVDILIVLSHLGLGQDKALAASVPGIDIIIGGNTRQIMAAPDSVGTTLVVQQGYMGEWIGRFKATFSAEGIPSNYSEESLALTPDYQDDPDMVQLVTKWNQLYPTPTPSPSPKPIPAS